MKLINNQEVDVSKGKHQVQINTTVGTAKLQSRLNTDGNTTFVDIPDSSVTASSSYNVTLTDCTIRPVLTGDAEMFIKLLSRSL